MTQNADEIRTQGAPSMTETGREVFSYHLYRYVGPWLERWGIERVRVVVGFEHSSFRGAVFEVDLMDCRVVEEGWTFEDLVHACRYGDGRLRVESADADEDTAVWECLPVMDRPADGGEPTVILGFTLYEQEEGLTAGATSDLQDKVAEAVRGARRNGVRMFFDERDSMPVKSVLYELMEHLSEWFGCDHSASLLMTSTVETMALKESSHGRFDILAERLFAGGEEADRLVGMSVLLGGEEAGLLAAAVERQRKNPELSYQVFERGEEGRWRSRQADGDWSGFHRIEREPAEQMYVFVPLLTRETPQTELLGFFCLAFQSPGQLSASVGEVLGQLGRRVSSTLRYSPLYTLSARKLWLVRQARQQAVAATEPGREPVERLEGLISDVTSMIAYHTEVPSLAIGYVVGEEGGDSEGGRKLRYAHPHGWTKFDQLSLPVDVAPEDRVDSGVSALAARLGRPFILAGGYGEGEEQSFKNYLWVNEDRREVVDARAPDSADVLEEDRDAWVLLSDYYKPARGRAYATLAYPITFGERVLGVITVEVERATSWVWWTGFGGQLFWEMLADELSWAFRELGPEARRQDLQEDG